MLLGLWTANPLSNHHMARHAAGPSLYLEPAVVGRNLSEQALQVQHLNEFAFPVRLTHVEVPCTDHCTLLISKYQAFL